ncbi:MAG: 2-isopropylmalate synthase [Syntrophomonadaceae bacterium]|nr:2-isopropylmalate synthase [Syntrophomonadaceae bacterium]
MSDRIYIFDTTLRDGEQSPGVSLNFQEKLDIGLQLSRLGIDVIEAGFPVISKGDFKGVKMIAEKVKGPIIAGLARATKGDIDAAWNSLKTAENPRIHTFLATSDIHLKYKLQKSREQALQQAVEAVSYAKKFVNDVEFSAEDGSRTDFDYLCQVVEQVIDAGAVVVNIPDTVGYATPDEYGDFIRRIMERVPNMHKAILRVHCHDDLGLAVANSLAANKNGARQIEGTINGIGERAGNASLEEVIMALYTRKTTYDKEVGIDYSQIYRTSRLVSSITGMPIQANKAVVGKNAFAHESGIHQDGVLKERTTYEIMSPELIGLPKMNLLLGKHSGRHAFNERLKELGYIISEEELSQAFTRFKDLADRKKNVTDYDIEALVRDQIWTVPERFKLQYLHFTGGSTVVPTATVGLIGGRGLVEEAACGAGPVEAACNAIDRITGIPGILEEYKLNAVTEGKDAQGEVVVKVTVGNLKILGRGLSTDIIEASVRAYVNAINKAANEIIKHDKVHEGGAVPDGNDNN